MLDKYQKNQPIAYRILTNDILREQLSHAYIFETNGYDEGLDMAIAFAKNILNPDGTEAIDEYNYLELKIIEPDGTWIKKEQLLDLQEEFSKKSIIGNKKVYIINHANQLSVNSANTILKFVEEPPEGIIAILLTDNVYHLIDTIVSRCQIISLNGQAEIGTNDRTLFKIMKKFSNSVEEFKNMNETTIQLNIDNVIKFIKYFESNGTNVLVYIDEYWLDYFNDKYLVADGLQLMIYFYKDCLNYKVGCEVEIFNDYMDDVISIANNNKVTNISKKLKIINDNKYNVYNNSNLYLVMDKLVIEMEGE